MQKGKNTAMVKIVQSSIQDLEREKKLPGLLIALFIDPWCSTCNTVSNIFKSKEFNNLRILEINIVTELKKQKLGSFCFMDKYSIQLIPVVIVFKDGVIIDHISGLKEKKKYTKYACYFDY